VRKKASRKKKHESQASSEAERHRFRPWMLPSGLATDGVGLCSLQMLGFLLRSLGVLTASVSKVFSLFFPIACPIAFSHLGLWSSSLLLTIVSLNCSWWGRTRVVNRTQLQSKLWWRVLPQVQVNPKHLLLLVWLVLGCCSSKSECLYCFTG